MLEEMTAPDVEMEEADVTLFISLCEFQFYMYRTVLPFREGNLPMKLFCLFFCLSTAICNAVGYRTTTLCYAWDFAVAV